MKSGKSAEKIQFWEKVFYWILWTYDFLVYLAYKLALALSYFILKLGTRLKKIRNRQQPLVSPFNSLKEKNLSRKILLLDLDGTLINASLAPSKAATKIKVNGETFYVSKRPHLNEFIKEAQRLYALGIYTASMQNYADQVIQILELENVIPKHMRFYRNSCDFVNGNYMKRVSKVEADLRNVLILDNRPEVIRDRKNIVKIESWTGGEDSELLKCLEKLKTMSVCDDVRRFIF